MSDYSDSHVLLPTEVELLVENLNAYSIKDIGGKRWQKHHEYLQKLNIQAIMSAQQQEEEFVKDNLITYQKLPVLIEELLSIEYWKENVFPVICSTSFSRKTTIPIYMVLYHEAVLLNLLETVFFHKVAIESTEDSLLDLLDYCYRKLTTLVTSLRSPVEEPTPDSPKIPEDIKDLQEQLKSMEFESSLKVMSILRYLTDALDVSPLSMTSRVLNTHNIPCLLVELIENSPWSKRSDDGQLQKFIDNKWQTVSIQESYQITKIEGQVWIAIYNLILNFECIKKYDMNSFNKAQILKLRAYLNEVLLDQLPMLTELRRYLEEISMTETAPPKQDLVLEQIPEIRSNLIRENQSKIKAIAKHQIKNYFTPSQADILEQAKRLADTYNLDVIDSVISEIPKCAVCGADATKRCSRCQQEWYCRRECQVKHWKKHKNACYKLCPPSSKT